MVDLRLNSAGRKSGDAPTLKFLSTFKSLNYELVFFFISSYSKNKSGASKNILFLNGSGAGFFFFFFLKANIQVEGNHIGVNKKKCFKFSGENVFDTKAMLL